MQRLLIGLLLLALSACATTPPPSRERLDDACALLRADKDWAKAVFKAEDKWDVPIEVQLAFIHQESKFVANARPPKRRGFLGVMPGERPSTAYGYAQALDGTWDAYRSATGNGGAQRDNFADSVDFVGWYLDQASRRLGIAKSDSYRLYLAYHEGSTGYLQGTYRGKPWLMDVARAVDGRTRLYQSQLQTCRKSLDNRGIPFIPFV